MGKAHYARRCPERAAKAVDPNRHGNLWKSASRGDQSYQIVTHRCDTTWPGRRRCRRSRSSHSVRAQYFRYCSRGPASALWAREGFCFFGKPSRDKHHPRNGSFTLRRVRLELKDAPVRVSAGGSETWPAMIATKRALAHRIGHAGWSRWNPFLPLTSLPLLV